MTYFKNVGLFIVVEGIDGAGKTTAAEYLYNYLLSHGIDTLYTREPGGTHVAEKIREILLNKKELDEELQPETELLLAFAARAQHMFYTISPALNNNKWVISDRFIDSSYAYNQCPDGEYKYYENRILSHRIDGLSCFLSGLRIYHGMEPNHVFLLDTPAAIAKLRQKRQDRIEKRDDTFFEEARQIYLSRAEKKKDIYTIIDASQNISHVKQQLKLKIDNIIAQYRRDQ